MKRHPEPDAVTKSARFLSGQVTVSWRRGRVTSVGFGRARTDTGDRKLGRDLKAVQAGWSVPATLHVDLGNLPEFSRAVLKACAGIPRGEVRTYGELATRVGRPHAARAVGQALARNPFPVIIPCHRVVASGGRLNGFGAGLAWKEALLASEGWEFEGRARSRRVVRSKVRGQRAERQSRRQDEGETRNPNDE